MSRPPQALLAVGAALAIGAVTSACGTQKISLSPSNPLYKGAVLFNQRCSGCHSLSFAATRGSAQYVRTKEFNNGPNFNVRCERPVTRVLYAIENGGFSGQIMPQNIVVGPDAELVARFVATYAGRQAPTVPGAVVCDKEAIGTIPSPGTGTASTASRSTIKAPNVPAAASTQATPRAHKHAAHKKSRRKHHRH